MKKVLFIVATLSMGGGENMIRELVTNIDKTKYIVEVLCYGGRSGSSIEHAVEETVKVTYLSNGGRVTPSSVISVFKAINTISPDVIHGHLGGIVYAMLWALLHKDKGIVITSHTKPENEFSTKIAWIMRWLLKHRSNRSRVVAVSEENHKVLLDYLSTNDRVCKYINNGINVNKFYRKEHEHFTFINLARQDSNKNQISIIRAFKRLYDCNLDIRLILAGDGPCHDMLVEQVSFMNLGAVVSFPGMVSGVENYYAVSDVYIQSSFVEAMPLSVLEAMAAGLPILSTDVGGLRDVVKDNGHLVSSGNDDELYEAMREIITRSKEEIMAMNEASRQIVRNYSSESMARKYESIYQEVM